MDCLAFGEKVVVLSESLEGAQNKSEEVQLQEQAGLRITYGKTQFMVNMDKLDNKLETRWIVVEVNTIHKAEKLMYLGELLKTNLPETEALISMVKKAEFII